MNPAALHLAVLRSAALLVPEQQRAEWLAEWRSELWHVLQGDPRAKHVMATCLGAFKDAFWLRRYGPVPRSYGVLHLDVPAPSVIPENFPSQEPPLLSSPIRCLSFFAILAALAISAAFLLPYARKLILTSWHTDARNLVLLTPADDWDSDGYFVPRLSVSIEQFQSLKDHPDGRFGDLAFYLPVPTQVGAMRLLVARTSADLFRLLGIAIPPGRGPRLILANAAWKKYFKGDPRAVGDEIQVGDRKALITGILSPGQWRLPGKMDAWLLEDDVAQSGLSPHAQGLVLATLHRAARSGNVGSKFFNYVPAEREEGAVGDDFFPSLIAQFFVWCLLAPITTRLSLGDYPRKFRPRQWAFLAAKILLVMPIMLFGSMALAGVGAIIMAPPAGLFAMRWVLDDQRNRCPVCLRLLSNPVRIGQSSHMFLEWHGTELICLHGHGLLHVPERPSIWFTRQRWMDLGTSWSGLFPY
jgi:hypothetical protein